MAKIRPRKKLEALSINEEVGDIPTHYFKSGSSMRPKEQLQDLNTFKKFLLPEEARGTSFEYDVWFNTNENVTIRKWLYTDFLGKEIIYMINMLYNGIQNFMIKSCFYQEVIYFVKVQ